MAKRDDWTKTTLGNLINLRTGKLDVNAGIENGEFPFFTCSRETYKIDVAAYAGKSVIVAGNGDLNVKYYEGEFNAYQRTYILQTVDEEKLNPLFLFHFMDKYVATLRNSTQGSTIQYLKKAQFTEAPISLPPLSEQKRIVDVVSSVDSYIDALQQHADSARLARNAVLHELLSTGGDDWSETTLGELCEIYQPETISKAEMDDSAPYIVYGANGPVGRYSRFNHKESEVVVTCRGATCGVVNVTPPNCWITGNAMVVRPRDNRTLKGFLFLALQTSVDLHATISGSAQPQITRTGLSPSKIQVPPIDEQKRIVEIVSSMDEVIQSTEQAVERAKLFRSGLLSDLLAGEHEIPESYDRFLGAA